LDAAASISDGGAPMTTAAGSAGALRLSGRLVLPQMLRRHHAHPHALAASDLWRVPGGVVDARLRLAREKNSGADVRSGISLGVDDMRQFTHEIGAVDHHLLHRS